MTKILVTVPSGESRQLKRVLVGLGIKEMIVSEVQRSGREAASPTSDPELVLGLFRPKLRFEILAPDVRVESIVQALLRRNQSA